MRAYFPPGWSQAVSLSEIGLTETGFLRYSTPLGKGDTVMSRVCQVSGAGPMKGHRRRHPHSGAWNLRAPKKNHTFLPNLQTVTVSTPEGKVRLKVTTSVMSSRNFQDYLTGVKPLPKELCKKSRNHIKKS